MHTEQISAPPDVRVSSPYPGVPCGVPLSTEMPARWYVLSTFARHEKAVADRLREKDFETYLPLYWSCRIWGQRRAQVQLPLFPGYVFVRASLTHKARILDDPGVTRLIAINGKATPVSDEEMSKLQASLEICRAEPYPYLTPGRRVRVKSGPLQGIEGTVIRRKGALKLIVQIDLIQRAVILELDALNAQLTA